MDHRLDEHGNGQLVEQGALQLSLLDEKNLAEISAPEYAGERLMVCHNPISRNSAGASDRRYWNHGEELAEDQPGSGAAEEKAAHRGGDWDEGGEGTGTLQNG